MDHYIKITSYKISVGSFKDSYHRNLSVFKYSKCQIKYRGCNMCL